MDNNFYETRRPRTKPIAPKEKPKNIMNKVIVIQLVLSLLVTGLLFFVCRTDSELSQNIKTFYSELSKNDMTSSELLATFKKVAEFTFAPSTEWDGTFSVDEAATENAGETTGEEVTFSPVVLTVNFESPLEKSKITSNFGYRISPITNKLSLHTGVDLASPENAKISAVCSGVVEEASYNEVRGNYIVINHGGNIKTTYNHCNELLAEKGTRIRAGETVALVGSTGYSTGPHLHFEVLLNGKYVNPLWVI